jgi:hypothetical protein
LENRIVDVGEIVNVLMNPNYPRRRAYLYRCGAVKYLSVVKSHASFSIKSTLVSLLAVPGAPQTHCYRG